MQLIVNKTQALQKQMISADGSSHSTEQQLRQALMAGTHHPQRCDRAVTLTSSHCAFTATRALISPAAERSEADALVQLEDKTRSLNLAKQQHAAEVQAIVAQHAKDKVAMEGRIRYSRHCKGPLNVFNDCSCSCSCCFRRLEVHNEQLLDQVFAHFMHFLHRPCCAFQLANV